MNFFEFWLFPGNQSYCVLLFLARSWGFLMRWKWHFRILPEKSRMAVFGLFSSKNGHFWQKKQCFGQFLKDSLWRLSYRSKTLKTVNLGQIVTVCKWSLSPLFGPHPPTLHSLPFLKSAQSPLLCGVFWRRKHINIMVRDIIVPVLCVDCSTNMAK